MLRKIHTLRKTKITLTLSFISKTFSTKLNLHSMSNQQDPQLGHHELQQNAHD